MDLTQTPVEINALKRTSIKLSREILRITTKAGSGHPSSSLSAIDVLIALYLGGVMRYDPQKPQWPDRDRFILSKGHGVPGLYVILAEAGYFDPDLLPTLRETGSPLEGHPNMRRVPGIEASTGSLGQGLSIGLGHALAGRLDGRDYRVYVMVGDGEIEEGQIWEATMAAAKYNVANLTLIVDHNKFQQTARMDEVMPSLEPLPEKWHAFGWHAVEIDGHDMTSILNALHVAQQIEDRPQVIVAHTLKGKGLSPFLADDETRLHGQALDEDQLAVALRELDEREQQLGQ